MKESFGGGYSKNILLLGVAVMLMPSVLFGWSIQLYNNIDYAKLKGIDRYLNEQGFAGANIGKSKKRFLGLALNFEENEKYGAEFYVEGNGDQFKQTSRSYTDAAGTVYSGGEDTVFSRMALLGAHIERRIWHRKPLSVALLLGGGFGYFDVEMKENVYYEDYAYRFGYAPGVYDEKYTTSYMQFGYFLRLGLKAKLKYFRWGKIIVGMHYDMVNRIGAWKEYIRESSYEGYKNNISRHPAPEGLNFKLNKYGVSVGLSFGGGRYF